MIDQGRLRGEELVRGLLCPECRTQLAWNGAIGAFCANARCGRFDELPELQDELDFRRGLYVVARSK